MIKKKIPSEKKHEGASDGALVIPELETGVAKFCILGMTPLIQHRMAEKARHELLLPRGGKLSAHDKRTHLKHDPLEEFRSAMYAPADKRYETKLIMPSSAFGQAMADAALDTAGAKRSEILRLTTVLALDTVNIPIFGIPQLHMEIVRMSDIKQTPDVRTRATLPQWGCYLSIQYVKPQLTYNTIANLLARAGTLIGIGDWRHQKGGNYGLFKLASSDDPLFVNVVKTGGRVAQEKAIEKPSFFNTESQELFTWFQAEMAHRERKAA